MESEFPIAFLCQNEIQKDVSYSRHSVHLHRDDKICVFILKKIKLYRNKKVPLNSKIVST